MVLCIRLVIWNPQLPLFLVHSDEQTILNLGTGEELGYTEKQ